MEIGFPGAVVTVVSFVDGNASLYFSSGGGIIGGFAHENVKQAAMGLVDKSKEYITMMSETATFPTPDEGFVRFYLITRSSVFYYEEDEKKLQNHQSPFTELYELGHNVITGLRGIAEKTKKN